MKMTDCAYAAGFIDADGCISLNRKKTGNCWTIDVYSTERAVLEWFHRAFPNTGRIYLWRTTKKILGKKPKPYYHWRVTSQPNILKILRVVVRFLILKREIALRSLRELALWRDRRIRNKK